MSTPLSPETPCEQRPGESPWYQNGLRFECTVCGACCTGDPGHVWVNKAEIQALAEAVGIDVEEFVARYVRRVGVRKSLVELPNGDCVLYDRRTRRCTVYEVRPRQCRSWPFWHSNVHTREHWEQTCQVCPGAGRGPLVPLAEIRAMVALLRI